MNWYIIKTHSAASVLAYRERLLDAGIEIFLPTKHVEVKMSRGGTRQIERSLVLNYIFVRTEEPVLLRFEDRYRHDLLVMRHVGVGDGVRRLTTIPARTMDMFIRTVGQYQSDVPFLRPTADMLERGDLVRILDGPFAGVEGILLSQQGKDGGRILVRISDVVAVPTLEIEPEAIEVLRFAPSSHHLYQKLNSLEPRLEAAMQARQSGETIPADLYTALEVFIRRYSHLTIPAINARVRFLSMLLQAYFVLNRHDDTARVADELRNLLPEIRSPRSREQVEQALALLPV